MVPPVLPPREALPADLARLSPSASTQAKLKKGRQAGNHAKAPQKGPPSPPPPVSALVSTPLAATTTTSASAAPGTSSEGTSRPASMASLGRSTRPPPGVGARSIRSVSSASVDTTASVSHAHHSPSTSPPATGVSSSAASLVSGAPNTTTSSISGSPSSNSALSSLRTRLDTDEARRTRLASSESASADAPASEQPSVKKKLQKKRPSASPDVFVDPTPTSTTQTQTPTPAQTPPKGPATTQNETSHSSDDGVVAYEDDHSSSTSPSPPSAGTSPKIRHVHYLDDEEDTTPPDHPLSHQTWLGWSLGVTTTVARALPIVSTFIPAESSFPPSQHELEEIETVERPPKVHGLVWELTEMALGLSLAGVLVAAVGAEMVVDKVWSSRGGKGKAIEA